MSTNGTAATSTIAASDVGTSSMASSLTLTNAKRETLRQTLESIHSESNSLLLFALQWKDLEAHFDAVSDSVAKRAEEVELKSKQVEWRRKYIEKKVSEIEAKEKRVEEMLKMVEERCKEIDATYQLVGKCYDVVREREKRCGEELENIRRKKECFWGYMDCEKKKLKQDVKRLKVREFRVERIERELEERREKLLHRLREVELREKRVDERVSELDRREKTLEVKMRDVMKARNVAFGEFDVHHDGDRMMVDDDSSNADIKVFVNINGRTLQNILNGRPNDHHILRDEITTGLGLSSDPAKLVLDAIQGFYPEELENGKAGFDLNVVRKSCILLLEQLIRTKPQIMTNVRERAMRVAMQWKERMKVGNADRYLEAVGFLRLVATYGLTYGFHKEELLMLLQGCTCYDKVSELCRNLGLIQDIHGIIQNFTGRGQPYEAIKLIYAFGLVDVFPPEPMLKTHLMSAFADAEKLCMNGNSSIETQITSVNMKLAALVSAVKCIKEYGIEFEYPIQSLKQQILALIMQKSKCETLTSPSNAQAKAVFEKLYITPNPPSSVK